MLSDTVYVTFHDALKAWYKEGKTHLTPQEICLSAKKLCDVILGLPDAQEGIDDELEDLEEEASCITEASGDVGAAADAMLIEMVAASMLAALSAKQGQASGKILEKSSLQSVILCIMKRWCHHELFDALKGKTNQHFRIMELAFDLGNYGQDRVGVQSVTETVKVRFNWNACCTPKKCRDYFRRVVTDGPVSRISFATIERRPCGSEIPVYGSYDASFDEELKPYIDNLLKARGLVDCPQALKLARKLMEENAEFARLSQNYVFENLSFRANVIAYLKACVLYVANGMKWEKSIEDFVRWSERYDLWCKLKLFGQMIYDADGEQDKVSRTAPNGPKNLLSLLPDEFTMDDYVKVRRAQGFDNDNARRIRDAIHQWVHRGYVAKVEGAAG